jgi:hypothetical protein
MCHDPDQDVDDVTREPYGWGWRKFKAQIWILPFAVALAWARNMARDQRWGLVSVAVVVAFVALWRLVVNWVRWARGE